MPKTKPRPAKDADQREQDSCAAPHPAAKTRTVAEWEQRNGSTGPDYSARNNGARPAGVIIEKNAPLLAHAAVRAGHMPVMLAVTDILPNPHNPRKTFDVDSLAELADSIKSEGLLQPLIVRPLEHGDRNYELIAGERRWRAATLAGLDQVPAIVRSDVDDAQALRLAVIENLQRRDINALEQANGFQALLGSGMTQAEVAEKIGVKQPTIAKTVALLKLPPAVQDRIAAGEVSATAGYLLLKYAPQPILCEALAGYLADHTLVTRDLEDPKDLPRPHILYGDGHIRNVGGYSCHFDWQAICTRCPYDAFVPLDGAGPLAGRCLRPDHWRELEEAATAPDPAAAALDHEEAARREEQSRNARERRLDEIKSRFDPEGKNPAIQALTADTLPSLSDLPRAVVAVEGCGSDCACFRVVRDHGSLYGMCIDPARQLEKRREREAESARRAQEEREHLADVAKQLLDRLPSLSLRKMLAIVCARALQFADSVPLTQALAGCGEGLPLDPGPLAVAIRESIGASGMPLSEYFETLTPEQLLRIAAGYLVCSTAGALQAGQASRLSLATWMLQDAGSTDSEALALPGEQDPAQ